MELCNYPRQGKERYFEIEAIELPIVYNKYGDHDPNGLLYVLKGCFADPGRCSSQFFSGNSAAI